MNKPSFSLWNLRVLSIILSFIIFFISWEGSSSASSKHIIFGGNKNLYPYEYLDLQNKPQGFNVELIRAISRINGWDPEFRLTDWSAAEEALREGEIDALLGLIYSEDKVNEFVFSRAHSNIEFSFFTHKDARPMFSLENLRGKNIGIYEMGAAHEFSRALAGFNQRTFGDLDTLFSALARGSVDVVLCPKMIGLHWLRKTNTTDIVAQDSPSFMHPYCFATRKGNSQLIAEMNEALAKLKESGEFFKLSKLLFYLEGKDGWLLFYFLASIPFLIWIICFGLLLRGRRNIQHSLTIFFLANSMIILLVVGILSHISERHIIEKRVESQLQTAVELKAITLSNWMEEARLACRSIADDLIQRNFPVTPLSSRLSRFQELKGNGRQSRALQIQRLRDYLQGLIKGRGYDEAFITDVNGVVIVSTDASHEGLDMSLNPAFWGAINLPPGDVYIRDIHYSESTHEISIEFSTTFKFSEGPWETPIGVVVLKAPVSKTIYALLRSWPTTLGTTDVLLLRKDGDRILCLNNTRLTPDMALKLAFPNNPETEMVRIAFKALRGERGVAEFSDYRGVPVLAAYSSIFEPISHITWAMIVKQDRNEALAEINKILKQNYFIIGSLLSILTAIAFFISGYVTKPIKLLDEMAKRVTRGDIGLELNKTNVLKRTNIAEIKNLAESFESMLRSLNERFTRSEKLSALGKLSAGLAHEIRTPLTSVRIILQSLGKQLHFCEEQLEDIFLAEKEIVRLNELVTRFLLFSQPTQFNFKRLSLNDLLHDTISILQPKINENNIQVALALQEDLGHTQGGEQLSQVFLNIVLNAIEAMRDGGVLTIRSEALVISEEAWLKEKRVLLGEREKGFNSSFVGISISDTGSGIASEIIQYIFDPFFTTKEGGTGLGLSIAFSIVEGHKGFCQVESSIPGGTTFKVILPISKEDGNE